MNTILAQRGSSGATGSTKKKTGRATGAKKKARKSTKRRARKS